MGAAVGVTRNGLGDMYLFSSRAEADKHPIIQYGDVICDGPESLLRQYNRLEMPDLLRRLGDEDFRSEVLTRARGAVGWEATVVMYSGAIWERMLGASSPPPEDPSEIISIIVRDRILSISDRNHTKKETTMAASEKTAPKTPEKAPATTIGGYALTSTITMLVDSEGRAYGPDNNPKKAGSKSADRFAKYGNGNITVEQAHKNGVLAADFAYDVNKKFIKID